MANKRTLALSNEDFDRIIATIRAGGNGFRSNRRVADALIVEGNLGIRISDVVKLRLCDIVHDGSRYRLDIVEQKTQKRRTFTVVPEMYSFLQTICLDEGIKPDERIFQLTERAVQKILKSACDDLGLDGVSTHSFRKTFATKIYEDSGYNVRLVQTLLQHASPQTTLNYICVGSAEVENALRTHVRIR